MASGNNAQGAKAGSSTDDELSMEEILQSIRKIIAEDEGDSKKTLEEEPEDSNDDILELTEIVEEKPAEQAAAPEMGDAVDILNAIDEVLAPDAEEKTPAPPAEPAKPLSAQDDIDALFANAAVEPEPAVVEPEPAKPEMMPEVALPPSKPSPIEEVDSLLSEEASHAATAAIQKLKSAEPELPPLMLSPSPAFRSGNTVEDMVADMLRPMMKSWLDANLPQIVERIVEREVKKLTKYITDPGD